MTRHNEVRVPGPDWSAALELPANRKTNAGSAEKLASAVRCGADLRTGTKFVHNNHIDPGSDSADVVRGASDVPVKYLINEVWSAGIMTLLQPVRLTHEGFGHDRTEQQLRLRLRALPLSCARPLARNRVPRRARRGSRRFHAEAL